MSPRSPGSFYRLLSLLLLPFWLIHAIYHGHKTGLKQYWHMRCYGNKTKADQQQVWVHAASVGEVEAISSLVNDLLKQGEEILFTSFTASGFNTIQKNFAERVEASIIPIDFIGCCWYFFRRYKIKCCLLMETELWPELLYQAAKNQIPIIQVNARLSDKSLKAPLFIRSQLRRTIAYLSAHLTRHENDKVNLMALGALAENIKIIGNLKTYSTVPINTIRLIQRPYILLASSHANEEHEFLQQRPQKVDLPLIVIAPRHPKRTTDIQQQLDQLGINYALRSLSQPITQDTEVYLADTLGELKQFMAFAQIVIMGGSFNSVGGHNLLEPANLSCAIITGPADSNIRQDIQLLGPGQGVLQVNDIKQCWDEIQCLLNEPKQIKALGENAKRAVQQQANIGKAYLAAISPYLKSKPH